MRQLQITWLKRQIYFNTQKKQYYGTLLYAYTLIKQNTANFQLHVRNIQHQK